MRDIILRQVSSERTRDENINLLRQSLQIILLKIIHESKAGSAIAFTGGTMLRLLNDLPRFSEDLDFSLVDSKGYHFESFLKYIQQHLAKLALPADLKEKQGKTVHLIYVRFKEVLYEAGLTSHADEKLPIRLEIDTNPPEGGRTNISLLSDIFIIPVLHFDLPSAFATKLHACLFRPYIKGRDYYDLMWYIGKKIRPNLTVVNNAVKQTESKAKNLDANSLKALLLNKISELDYVQLRRDLAPFLLYAEEISLVDPALMQQVISTYHF